MKFPEIIGSVFSPFIRFGGLTTKRGLAYRKEDETEIKFPTTKEGTTIPVLFGTRDISSPILGWYGDVVSDHEQPGDGLDYYIGALFVLAHGHIERMTRISYGDRLIWSGNITDGSDTIEANNNFEDGSCLSGKFYFDNGANSNQINGYLSDKSGVNVKYNGLSHVILEHNYIGKAPNLKAPKFRCYGKPAPAYSFDPSGSLEKIEAPETALGINATLLETAISGWDATWFVWVDANEKPTSEVEFSFSFFDTNPDSGTYQVAAVTAGDDYQDRYSSENFDYYADFTTYQLSGVFVVKPGDFKYYGEKAAVIISARIANHDPSFSAPIFTAKIPAQVDANPAHILYACLTNKVWGLGYADSAIQTPDFLYAAEYLKNTESFGLSLLWSESSSIEEIVNEVLRTINGVIYQSRETGRFRLSLIRKDYSEPELLVLDSSNIMEVSSYTRGSFDDLYNAVNLSYYSTQLGGAAGVSVSDLAATQEQGITRSVDIDFPALSNDRTAKLVAARELKRSVTLQEAVTISAKYDAQYLNIGDAFIVNYPKYWADPVVMRVAKVDFGNGRSNTITIDAVKEWI